MAVSRRLRLPCTPTGSVGWPSLRSRTSRSHKAPWAGLWKSPDWMVTSSSTLLRDIASPMSAFSASRSNCSSMAGLLFAGQLVPQGVAWLLRWGAAVALGVFVAVDEPAGEGGVPVFGGAAFLLGVGAELDCFAVDVESVLGGAFAVFVGWFPGGWELGGALARLIYLCLCLCLCLCLSFAKQIALPALSRLLAPREATFPARFRTNPPFPLDLFAGFLHLSEAVDDVIAVLVDGEGWCLRIVRLQFA